QRQSTASVRSSQAPPRRRRAKKPDADGLRQAAYARRVQRPARVLDAAGQVRAATLVWSERWRLVAGPFDLRSLSYGELGRTSRSHLPREQTQTASAKIPLTTMGMAQEWIRGRQESTLEAGRRHP